jgi:hypothetical protein
VCWPAAGTGPMAGAVPVPTGGGSARIGPAGEPTSVQRCASWGWASRSVTVFIRPFAIRAASSSASTWSAVCRLSAASISACSSARAATRASLVANRGSPASSGRPSTCSHSRCHSRSFCTPSWTAPPPPVRNVPYGAIVAWLVPVRAGGVPVYIA